MFATAGDWIASARSRAAGAVDTAVEVSGSRFSTGLQPSCSTPSQGSARAAAAKGVFSRP